MCLWNHDYLYAPLKTASLKIVKKKQNASLFLLFSEFWLPTALLELPSRDAFSHEAGATPVPTPFLHHLSLRCTQQLLGSSREGLYLCFSSSGKSSLTQAKFNRPVQIGGPWKIPGEEMSISCYFSLSLPSSKAYRGSSSTFSSPFSKSWHFWHLHWNTCPKQSHLQQGYPSVVTSFLMRLHVLAAPVPPTIHCNETSLILTTDVFTITPTNSNYEMESIILLDWVQLICKRLSVSGADLVPASAFAEIPSTHKSSKRVRLGRF